jgi:hypothetical protein
VQNKDQSSSAKTLVDGDDFFSDFEEDELFLSMDVDAVIQQQEEQVYVAPKFYRIQITSVQDIQTENTRIKVDCFLLYSGNYGKPL